MSFEFGVVGASASAPLLNGAAGAHAELRTALLRQQILFSEKFAFVQVLKFFNFQYLFFFLYLLQ